MGKPTALTVGGIFLNIFSVSFLSLKKKQEKVFVCILIKTNTVFTDLLRQAVSKGLCCVGTSISDVGRDIVSEVVCFKKKTLGNHAQNNYILMHIRQKYLV